MPSHESSSDEPSEREFPESSDPEPSAPEPASTKPSSPPPSRGTPVTVWAALVIALVALGLAAWPFVHPLISGSESESDATSKVCGAYDTAFRAVKLQTNQGAPDDPSGPLAAAANARLSLVVASNNLNAAVDASPAAPDALKDAARKLAASYNTVVTNYLAGDQTDSPGIKAAFDNAGSAATSIDSSCKK